jgi:polyribonucleotide nucleotidyltransferase
VNDAGEIGILMVEADATPQAFKLIEAGAPQPTEDVIGQALEDVKSILREICDAQRAFVDEVGVRDAGEFKIFTDYDDTILEAVDAYAADKLREVYLSAAKKQEQLERIGDIREETVAHLKENGPADLEPDERAKQAKQAFRTVEKKIVRALITEDGRRVDGRGTRDIRPLSAEVGVLTRVHGSSIFQRGETQVMNILALGMLRDAQRIDTLDPEDEKRYMHHYNFLPYSTGETGGSCAARSVARSVTARSPSGRSCPSSPTTRTFPYAMRLVSEVLSLQRLDVDGVGVRLDPVPHGRRCPHRGSGRRHRHGPDRRGRQVHDADGHPWREDAFGDMDFKVAGTREIVTALQLDTKLSGIPARCSARRCSRPKRPGCRSSTS